MAVSSQNSDPLERALAAVAEEYRSRLDVQALDRAVELARAQAVHLRMENRPLLVGAALRDYLDSLWWHQIRPGTGRSASAR